MKLGYLCLLVLVCSEVHSCFTSMPIGVLQPRDSNYLVGENVTLRCILNRTSINMKDGTEFRFNSSFITFKFVNNSMTSKLNSPIEAETLISNGQPNDTGNYYCYLDRNGTLLLVCLSGIKFGYPPEGVRNFKCRSYYWENLTCSWTVPPNPANVSYKLSYSIDSTNLFMNCNTKSKKATSCGWTLDQKPLYVQQADNLTMRMIGDNSIGTRSTQYFTFNHWSILIPRAPTSLTVTNITTTELFVSWKPPGNMNNFSPGLCYRIKYGKKSSPVEHFLTEDTGANETSIILTGLIPYTLYMVQVQARSCEADADAEEDLWSSASAIVDRTKEDVPWSSPEPSGTFFDVVNYNSSRSVTVYWKKIEKEFENGDMFHYVVSLEKAPGNRSPRDTNSIEDSVIVNHKKFQNLDLNTEYLVKIWSANAKGSSPTPTQIIIPKDSKLLPRPLHVRPVSEANGKYEISWKAPAGNVKTYTLIWCQGERRCERGLDWKIVNSSTTKVSLSLDDNKIYDFGVAAFSSDNHQGSGIEWAPCTAYKNRVVDQLIGVSMDEVGPRGLTVSWKPACEAQKAVIKSYQVLLCCSSCQTCSGCQVTSCKYTETKFVSNPEVESIVLQNLTPYTSYGVTVVAISDAGGSRQSSPVCTRTLSDAPSEAPVPKFSEVSNTSATVSWLPSNNTNGIVNHYKINYREVSRQNNRTPDVVKEVNISSELEGLSVLSFDLKGLKCFTDYSVTVSACVDTHCSKASSPLYFKTNIGVPGLMDPPRTEVINSSHVRVVWKPPEAANGPLDYYLLHLFKREGNNITRLDLVNVTETSVELPRDCSPDVQTYGSGAHLFSVQAVNLLSDGESLYGPISNNTETKLCLMGPDMNNALVIGIIVGSTLALAFVILSLYSVLRWMKAKVDKMKNIKVILPDGLQQPYSQSLNSYENFKNGLSGPGSDPNLSPKLGYGRSDSNSENADNNNTEDSFKNRHGSGTSHFSTTSTDELIGKHSQGGQITAPKHVSISGQKTMNKGDRNPSGDSSSGHDSISSSLTHRTNLSTDGSSSSEGPSAQGKDPQSSSRDSGLEEDSKPSTRRGNEKVPISSAALPVNSHYLPTAPYSKLGLMEGKHIGDYLPLSRSRHLNLYSHHLANSEPSITDLSQQPYTLEQHAQCDPESPGIPYSKFGMSHSVTDLILEGIELPDSPLSSPQDAMPYSRFGLRRLPPANQSSPYVGMALLMGHQKVPNQFVPSKMEGSPMVLKSPVKKDKHPPDLLATSDDAYSKLGRGSVTDETGPPKFHPYLTLQEVKENGHNHSLPDLTISSREESPSRQVPNQMRHAMDDASSKSGYLPHQLIPSVNKAPETVLPDCVTSIDLQGTPDVKIQGSNGYVTLNQLHANNANI